MSKWHSYISEGLFVDSSLGDAPNLAVATPNDLNECHSDGIHDFPFKHGNWNKFICHVDDELRRNYYKRHNEVPKFGLVWLGKCVVPNF